MPGYAEYLDVESAIKVLGNILPSDESDADGWKQVDEMVQKLDDNVGRLVTATKGRSQEATANELKETIEQLVRAVGRVVDGSGDAGGTATVMGAVKALPNFLSKFDEERLQRK